MKENKELLKKSIEKFKAKAHISINTTASALNPNKYNSSYDQPSAGLIKWPLLK